MFFESVPWPSGPHHSCAALKMVCGEECMQKLKHVVIHVIMQVDWSSKSVSTVIDIVKRPAGIC